MLKVFSTIGFYLLPLMLYATPLCKTVPDYNIVVTKTYVQMINSSHNLVINEQGEIALDNVLKPLQPEAQLLARTFQTLVRERMHFIEHTGYTHIEDIKNHFTQVIVTHAGKDSRLLRHLNRLHLKLTELFSKAINTQGEQTTFNYRGFNALESQGNRFITKEATKILADSIIELRLKTNIQTLNALAKNAWKEKKSAVKTYQAYVCDSLALVDQIHRALITNLITAP